MVSVITENDIENLKKYVIFHDCDEEHIVELCKKQPPVTLTVYRGQQRNETLHDANTYSCSLSEYEASKFAGENCCLFVIHLINVPCIDVNALVGKEIGLKRRKEQEIIILGGGKFYSDQSFSEEGFIEIAPHFNKRRFECWYSLQEKHSASEKKSSSVDHSKIKRALDTIDANEYEFIDSIDDILLPELHLTTEEKIEIFNIICKMKNGGTQLFNKKSKKKTNSKIKYIRKYKKNSKFSKKKNNKRKSYHKIKGGMFHTSTTSKSSSSFSSPSHTDDVPPPSYFDSFSYPVLPIKMKPKLKPIVSKYWSEITCDKTVNIVGNGNKIFEDLILFLNSHPKFYFPHINPETYEKFSEDEKIKYINFYNNEENKKWLGCQIYLLTTIKDILRTGYTEFDDGNYFFRWLTHRLKDGDPDIFIEEAPNL